MTVTDEMVAKAYRGMTEADAYSKDFVSETGMRAALEAVAPMLIAQGVYDAAKIVSNWNGLLEFEGRTKLVDHLFARAQELDPK